MAFRDVVNGAGTLITLILEIVWHWLLRAYRTLIAPSREEILLKKLKDAKSFHEWQSAAVSLDELQGNDLWRQNPISSLYDHRLISSRLHSIAKARADVSILPLIAHLRSGLVRNLGNITSPRLFNRAFEGTKLLIEQYVSEVVDSIHHVANTSTDPVLAERGLGITTQTKLDILHDTRQAFGRSALVLQGGLVGEEMELSAPLNLWHLGAVKALSETGLLPCVIAGSGSAAFSAALVGVSTEQELAERISFEALPSVILPSDMTVFKQRKPARGSRKDPSFRRLARREETSILSRHIYEKSEMTFEEAYNHSGRILNITIPVAEGGDLPFLMNYVTAPYVLVNSAASTSAIARPSSTITLTSRTPDGDTYDTTIRTLSSFGPLHFAEEGEGPLARISELFNVNHFVIARSLPTLVPPLDPQHRSSSRLSQLWQPMRRLLVLEAQHRVRQLQFLSLIPASLAWLLLENTAVPGTQLTISPSMGLRDVLDLFSGDKLRSTRHIEAGLRKGERSVWSVVKALKVRCAIEFAIDEAYQNVKQPKLSEIEPEEDEREARSAVRKRRRIKTGDGPEDALSNLESGST